MDKIKKLVGELLTRAKISEPSISVESIAELLKIRVKYAALEGNISGLVYHKGKRTIIGINGLHPVVRQRFTLAHELGHVMLAHKGEFFLDRTILFRDSKSGEGVDAYEIEANKFAAELLMPEEMVRKDFRKVKNLDEDEIIFSLATTYEVSTQAMAIRLQKLGLMSF